MEGGYVAITGDPRSDAPIVLNSSRSAGSICIICFGAKGTQKCPAEGMECKGNTDIFMFGNKTDYCVNFWFRGRKRSCALLFIFGPPFKGKIAVKIQPGNWTGDFDLVSIVILDQSFGQEAVKLALEIFGVSFDHEPWILVDDFPIAVWVYEYAFAKCASCHRYPEHAGLPPSLPMGMVERQSEEMRIGIHRCRGPIGIDAGDNIKCYRIQLAGNPLSDP